MKLSIPTLAGLTFAAALAGCGPKTETSSAESAAPAAETAATPPASTDAMGGMPAAAAKTAKGTGTVTAIDAATGAITIDHAPIAEAGWPAMTMGFKASADLAKSVKVGDKVAFDLKLENGGGEITAIAKQ